MGGRGGWSGKKQERKKKTGERVGRKAVGRTGRTCMGV